MRREFLTGKVFDSVDDAQAQLDAWVHSYNHDRPHRSLGGRPPIERFALAGPRPEPVPETDPEPAPVGPTRKVTSKGRGLLRRSALQGRQVVDRRERRGRLRPWSGSSCSTAGTLIATHAQRHPATKQAPAEQRGQRPAPAKAARTATTASVTRKVDTSGSVCFAGSCYRVGNAFKRRQVQVTVVGDTVEISIGNGLIRTGPVKHDPTREHGALANPGGGPRRTNAA